ncbi:hypothetical protein J5X75_42330 [Actinoplanes sp. NEAU-H7]|uniref:Integral membrane protein n=1 Tax=Actinoplanes flavus TaxID=2820290 RepID=A0ABS3UZZ6_9ACTN|nr:hypothetical protein [Actinoplanes flavus]
MAFGLLTAATVTGAALYQLGRPVHASSPPLFAHWLPHAGPGTPAAVGVAVLVWRYGPDLAARWPWRTVLAASYMAALAWTLSLALVDGWQRGVAGRLTTEHEYLHEVPGITDIPATLAGFTARILDFQPDSWTTHVSAHPPGALLVFVWLDRAGLGGGGWAAMLCLLVAGLVGVAVPHTVRLLATDGAGRAVAPFAVLFPGAVWSGVSADGLFAGATAAGVALLAHGVVRGRAACSMAGGVLLTFGCYLSYGLVLVAPIVVVVLILAGGRRRAAGWAVVGAFPVVAAFTAAGFHWPTGYHLVIERYYQGIATDRPYAYWVWANLAVLAAAAGPAAAVVVRRAFVAGWRAFVAGWRAGRPSRWDATAAVWLLPIAATTAIVAADLSGYSKAEVERIWLPFGVWLMAGAALIPAPDRRRWLAVQAMVALTVNHLLLTVW